MPEDRGQTEMKISRLMNRKYAMALLLVFSIASACSKAPNQPRNLRFAIIPKALHIPVFDYARTGAERAARRFGGIEVLWRGPESTDEIRQKEILE